MFKRMFGQYSFAAFYCHNLCKFRIQFQAIDKHV